MTEIHLQVVAGLANRIRALISGICFAEDEDVRLVVHWSPDQGCGSRFESLFDANSLPDFVSVTSIPLLKHTMCLLKEDLAAIKKDWDRSNHLFIKSYGHFHRSDMTRWIKHLRKLEPTQEIRQEIELRLPPFDQSRFLGVHIRRGDNLKSIELSPIEAFFRRMDRDDSVFIVATDDIPTRNLLKQRYAGRIWFPAKTLERHTEQGMKEAMIDFFSLARCPSILGSFYSSFTEIAALYGNSRLEFAT
jgi:hypothetical protein